MTGAERGRTDGVKKEMPYGLVLAGGGAKGVYQIGAWKALRELGIAVDCVVGTSVGAMNGALVALGLYDEAEALWKSMSIERGFQLSAPLRRPDKLFSIQNAGILVRELWKHHGLDITPLRRRLEELVDEQALRASPVEYGLVTYEVTGRKGRELFKEKIPEGRLMDYIMASAAYPGLRRIEIDGKTYLDGGLVDNVPVQMLLNRKKEPVVVVDIGDGGLPAGMKPSESLIYVKPLEPLGTAFEFQPETAQRKMDMGYMDTLKAFGRLSGTWMYFENAEYDRLLRRWGKETVEGVEHYARLLGMNELRVCTGDGFVRELLEYEKVSAEKFRLFRSQMDIPSLTKALARGSVREYSLTGDLLLQLAQAMLEDGEKRRRLIGMAQKVRPELMKAAAAMLRVKRAVEESFPSL